jgi:oxaloacetate decarboxylase gamma subunit
MVVTDLLMEGVNLMLLGMGIVFVFLSVLVLALNGMSRFALALADKQASEPHPATTSTPCPEEGGDELIAVITTAINRYRSRDK